MNHKQRELFAGGMLQIATAAIATLTFGEVIAGRQTRVSVIFLGIIAAVVLYGTAYLLLDTEKK